MDINSNNNNEATSSKMPEPTLADIFHHIQECATREDILDIKSEINAAKIESKKKFNTVNHRIDNIEVVVADNRNTRSQYRSIKAGAA